MTDDKRDRPYIVIYHVVLIVVLFIGFIRLENAGEHYEMNSAKIARAHDSLCLSHLSLLKDVGDVATEALSPFVPPSTATPSDLEVIRALNAQKQEHLREIRKELRAAGNCPRL